MEETHLNYSAKVTVTEYNARQTPASEEVIGTLIKGRVGPHNGDTNRQIISKGASGIAPESTPISGVRRGWGSGGSNPPPAEPEKIVVEKCYFRSFYF